ncbi:DUF5313 family protein [Segniliparus rugosus]|uniref:DUF5313 domain-containing protein n=1 Tax=Segniliparus rugosus (strain ATCC BAA-974 / DSM 45345 / CCUG 50838 / CIP 108380 / JCM 13579 / CDC 945) TaxID=679197 RepID=E5XPL2_SEGRC|nr:DUF5313 family protein [Segniliparus rugosus]EFV13699.1 hypothetical protein HMPREF9336_01434 [Segniliparus rugosus ATCC BAA-974]
MTKPARTKPNFFQWMAYAHGRKLPDSMQEWVKNDLTGDWAGPRHLWRSMVPFLPIFALILVLVPGQLWLRGAMVLLMVILALIFSGAYMKQNKVSRLIKHGLPADLENPKKVRAREESRARYLEIYGVNPEQSR